MPRTTSPYSLLPMIGPPARTATLALRRMIRTALRVFTAARLLFFTTPVLLTTPVLFTTLLFFTPTLCHADTAIEPQGGLNWLSAEERDWLKAHDHIRLAPAPDFPPVEFFDDDGHYRGIAADYIRQIEATLGIVFEIKQYTSWSDVVEAARRREVDLWPEAAVTPARQEFMSFTKPYLTLPAVIITRGDHIGRASMEDLAGKIVAVVKGYAIHEWVTGLYPSIQILPVNTVEEGLRKVSYGEADAIIEANAPAIYYIEKNGLINLHVAGESGFSWQLSMAVRSDWEPLRDILQKTLDRIPQDQKNEIFRNWVSLKQYGWAPSKSLLLSLGAVFVVAVIIVVLAWNRSLKRLVDARTHSLEQRLQEIEAEQRARYQQERSFNQIFNAADCALVLHELDGRLMSCNEAALTLFGLRATDLEHLQFPRDFVAPEADLQRLAESWERVVQGCTERFLLQTHQPHDKTPVLVQVCSRRIHLNQRDGVISTLKPADPAQASASLV